MNFSQEFFHQNLEIKNKNMLLNYMIKNKVEVLNIPTQN